MTNDKPAAPDKSSAKATSQKGPSTSSKPTLSGKSNENKKQPTKKTANWSLRILVVFLIFIAGAAASIYFMPLLKERLPIITQWVGDTSSADLAAVNQTLSRQQVEIDTLKQKSSELEARIGQASQNTSPEMSSALEARISALEEKLVITPEPPSTDSPSTVDSSQSTRIDMLLSRMSQLEASFVPLSKSMIDAARAEKERQGLLTDNASLANKVSQLESRLNKVEQVAAKDNSAILLNLKIAELKKKIFAGVPYNTELNTVQTYLEKSTLSNDPSLTNAINILSANASIGTKTADQLRLEFNAIIPELLRTKGINEDASWWQNTLTRIMNMVTVRKTDGTSLNDKSIDGVIANIEAELRSGNFKTVLNLVDQLPTASKTPLGTWISSAESWLQSETAISHIESAATENYLSSYGNSTQEALT